MSIQSLAGKVGECRHWGLSTDTKPDATLSNGYGFYEADTGLSFISDGISWNLTTAFNNVDNTSDLDKPISTATQTALDSKQTTLVSATNIKTINGGSVLGSGDLVVSGSAAFSSITGVYTDNASLVTGFGTKQNTITTGTTAQYFRGDLSLATFPTTTASFANSTDKNFVTDVQATVIGNTSGTNSGNNAVNTLYSGLVSNATHTGDATGTAALTVVAINGVSLGGLATGILKNTTTTGVPSIAVAGDFPTLNQNTTGTAGGLSANIAESQVTNLVSDLALKAPIASPTFTGVLTMPTGDASNAPVKYVAGTLKTIPAAGDVEMDANCFYRCTDAGNRGYIPVRHIIRADSTRTFTSNTSAQAIFNSPTNGRLTLETGTYLMTGLINIGSMSATSGNLLFNPLGGGTATMAAILYHVVGVDGATGTAATQTGSTMVAAASPASIVTAGVGTAITMKITGTFEITGAGTIIPSITMVTASASVVATGSYLTFERIGSTTVVSVGQWD